MLLMNRSRVSAKRASKSTVNAIKTCNSLFINPEIEILVDKVGFG
jgi:hypothetical protein